MNHLVPLLAVLLACAPMGACDSASLDASALVQRESADRSWLARAQRSIERREYWASENADGLQAPNRAHNLRTYFDEEGIRVHDRTASGSTEFVKLSLFGVGRDDAIAEVGAGELVSDGARVEIRRRGLVEWYENSEAGLEQGFTLAEPPRGEGELVLELAVAGARAAQRDEGAILETRDGRRLAYGKLVALDATGRKLAARLEVAGPARLRLHVADLHAAYPLVIDPLLTAIADSQLEANQVEAELGYDVEGAGDVNGDGYDDVIVSAWEYDHGTTGEGVVFIFHGSASGIVANGNPTNADSQLESNTMNVRFGWKVAGAGDVNDDGYDDVMVSSFEYPTAQMGGVWIYHGSATGIVAAGSLGDADSTLLGDQGGGDFGYDIAAAGDVNGDGYDDVIIGANQYVIGGTPSVEGAAFVFHGSPTGVVATGGPSDADSSFESNQLFARLGAAVAGAGDVNGDGYDDVILGIGAYDAPETSEGIALVFHGSATGLVAAGNPTNADSFIESNQMNASLGAVDGAGDVNGDGYDDVLIGAPGYDDPTALGLLMVFQGSATGIVASGTPRDTDSRLKSDVVGEAIGGTLGGAGDVNGDGYDDIITGNRFYTNGEDAEGAAWVFLGSSTGILAEGDVGDALVQLEGNLEDAWFGQSLAGAGDVNGDGSDDVIVGAPHFTAGSATHEGAAFVFLGSPAEPLRAPGLGGLGAAVLAGLVAAVGFAASRRERRHS